MNRTTLRKFRPKIGLECLLAGDKLPTPSLMWELAMRHLSSLVVTNQASYGCATGASDSQTKHRCMKHWSDNKADANMPTLYLRASVLVSAMEEGVRELLGDLKLQQITTVSSVRRDLR